MSCGPPEYLCPACRQPAFLVVGAEQAFCGTEDTCRVLCWNPSLPDGGMSEGAWVLGDDDADEQFRAERDQGGA